MTNELEEMKKSTDTLTSFIKAKDILNKIWLTVLSILITASLALVATLIGDIREAGLLKKYLPVTGPAVLIEKDIIDLLDREKKLTSKPVSYNLNDVYTEGACLVKKINGTQYTFSGIDEIEKDYKNVDLRVDEYDQYNLQVFYTKYEGDKPLEAIVTYDMMIKYEWKGSIQYELKTGKEFMKISFDKVKNKWLINFFYVESDD